MKYPDDYIDKVICGDCLEVMKGIPDDAVDFVFADPPYAIGKAEWDTEYPVGFEQECLRVSHNGVAITSGQKHLATCINSLNGNYKGVLAAINLNGMTFSAIGFENWIPVVLAGNIKRGQNWFKFTVEGYKPNHPCPKPLRFMTAIVERFTDKNDLILDPFFGSGTTAVACKQLNRRFIGIEINPDYCKIARERLMAIPESLFK